jgi:hypothetical protein
MYNGSIIKEDIVIINVCVSYAGVLNLQINTNIAKGTDRLQYWKST